MKNFAQAQNELNGRERRKIRYATWLEKHDDFIGVRHHDTIIIKYYRDRIVVDCDGRRSKTSKDRINDYTPLRVWQHKHVWRVNRKHYAYYDGITCDNSGTIISEIVYMDETKNQKKLQQIDQYVEAFAQAKVRDEIEPPSAGDCWYCFMVASNGNTVGDEFGDRSHLWSHIAESYFVPSLLYKAIEEKGYPDPGFIWKLGSKRMIVKALKSYLVKRLVK